jgi:uncharacterized membrane protein HdeD (DUF308 family)
MIFISGIFLLIISCFYKKGEANVIPAFSLILGIILLCSGIVHLFKDLKNGNKDLLLKQMLKKYRFTKKLKQRVIYI